MRFVPASALALADDAVHPHLVALMTSGTGASYEQMLSWWLETVVAQVRGMADAVAAETTVG